MKACASFISAIYPPLKWLSLPQCVQEFAEVMSYQVSCYNCACRHLLFFTIYIFFLKHESKISVTDLEQCMRKTYSMLCEVSILILNFLQLGQKLCELCFSSMQLRFYSLFRIKSFLPCLLGREFAEMILFFRSISNQKLKIWNCLLKILPIIPMSDFQEYCDHMLQER